MHAPAPELEPARDDESTPSMNRNTKAPCNSSTKHSTDREHFSPDPYESTDRYRLVTPYTLLKHR